MMHLARKDRKLDQKEKKEEIRKLETYLS